MDSPLPSAPSEIPRVPIQVARGCLIASLSVELQDQGWIRFQQDLLERIRAADVPRVVLDLSGIDMLDSRDFDAIRRAVAMAELMGARTVLSGLRPGVVSALIGMDVDLEGLEAVATPDDAFALLTESGADDAPVETDEDGSGDSNSDPS